MAQFLLTNYKATFSFKCLAYSCMLLQMSNYLIIIIIIFRNNTNDHILIYRSFQASKTSYRLDAC